MASHFNMDTQTLESRPDPREPVFIRTQCLSEQMPNIVATTRATTRYSDSIRALSLVTQELVKQCMAGAVTLSERKPT